MRCCCVAAETGTLWEQGCRCRHPRTEETYEKCGSTPSASSLQGHTTYRVGLVCYTARLRKRFLRDEGWISSSRRRGRTVHSANLRTRHEQSSILSPAGVRTTPQTAQSILAALFYSTVALPCSTAILYIFLLQIQIYKHRKETKPMLKQQTNQITVVHILRDMFLNPTN